MKLILSLKLLFVSVFLLAIEITQAQDSSWQRTYQFGAYNQFDLRNSSGNAIATHRVLQDVFRKNVKPQLGTKTGNITGGIYSFATTYLTMLWSHEFGHSLRAKQVSGYFKIHNFGLPIPYTTMHLPDDISLSNEALSVTAGFEVNSLSARQIQQEFVAQNGIYNEDLGFAFANRLMYPLYSLLILPRNPEDKETWTNTAGDPVHVALPVFKNYANGQVFRADSSVNPALVRYYNQSTYLGLLFNLLDPQMYREVGATFGKNKTRRPIFLLGDYTKGWTYGTLFNVSPLGYELYLNNYIHWADQHFMLYLKYGNPFKNNGVGLVWNRFVASPKVQLSAKVDAWDQDLFGKGLSTEIQGELKLSKYFGLMANLGYKSKGYVLGKQLEAGLNLGGGLIYYTRY